MIFLLSTLLQFYAQTPYCNVYGVMVEVESRREADYIVFEQSSESFADIVVYDQDNKLFANKPGQWHFVDNKRFAKYRLFFTNDQDEAHFSVFFTDFESFAGCNP